MKSYYYVNHVKEGHLTVRHPNLHAAHVDALRLSTSHPGEIFEILMCLGITRTSEASTFWMDGVNPYQSTNQSNEQ